MVFELTVINASVIASVEKEGMPNLRMLFKDFLSLRGKPLDHLRVIVFCTHSMVEQGVAVKARQVRYINLGKSEKKLRKPNDQCSYSTSVSSSPV